MPESGNKDEKKEQAPVPQGPQPDQIQDNTEGVTPQSQASLSQPEVFDQGVQPTQNAASEERGDRQSAGTQPYKSFWEAVDDLFSRRDGPLPIRIFGLVLSHLPPPWKKRVLVTVLIAVIIGIVYSVGQPVWHVCDSLYCWITPGPPVQVTFMNETKKEVTIDKPFEYWLLASREDNRDPGLARGRWGELPIESITIPSGEPNKVLLRLGRGLSIRRIYRSGAWLRLRFNQENELEAEELWGKAVSDDVEFIVRIYDQNDWTSSPITVQFSEMKDMASTKKRAAKKVYLQNESLAVIRMIKKEFDVFETLVGDREPNRINVEIRVGCYTANSEENAIDIEIVDNGDVYDHSDIDTYENTRPVEEVLLADRLAREIRRRIFTIYPLQGVICDVEPQENQPSGEQTPHKLREVQLNIGSLAGVRKGDEFETLPSSNRRYSAGFKLKIDCVTAQTSIAFLSWGKEIEKGWCVRWKKAGL